MIFFSVRNRTGLAETTLRRHHGSIYPLETMDDGAWHRRACTQYIPYKGSTDVVADLRTGRLQAAIDNVAVMRQHIQAGYVRALAVTSRKPSSVLPGVPTVAESGLAGFEAVGWFGVFAPAGTPKAVLDTLSGNLQSAMRADGLRNQFATLGAEPQSGSAQDLQKLLADEIRVWSEIIKSANITAQ